ncbi:DoxX family protein [Myxococcota bacterium]|nr:DoxX family protein [Myxococcota bacterium]
MSTFLSQRQEQTYAALRIVSGFLFFWHGCQKIFGFPAPAPEMPAVVLYAAGGIELVAGAMIALGWFTRGAAFLSSGLMAAAYWMAHGLQHPLPLINHGELAALYCFVFLFIATRGAGIWSLDGPSD